MKAFIKKAKFFLLLLTLLFSIFTQSVFAAGDSFNRYFSLETGVWGDSADADVEAVLQSVLDVYENIFGAEFIYYSQGNPTQIEYRTSVPFTAYNNSVIYLSSQDRRWAQLMYQYGHEMYHYITHYHSDFRGDAQQSYSRHAWFEEAICEAMSIIVLKESAKIWKTSPPYPNWASYASSLSTYADDCITDNERQYNEHNYSDVHTAINTELKNLIADPSYPNNERHIQGYIANYIVEYYSEFGYGNISSALKTLMDMSYRYENLSFDEYITKWSALSDNTGRNFIRFISEKMRIMTPSQTPAPSNTSGLGSYSEKITLRVTMNQKTYTMNGNTYYFDVAPYLDTNENRSMIPMRYIAISFGATITWNDQTQTQTISLNGKTFNITKDVALPNGMGTPRLINDRFMVPLRYVSEMLGAQVEWEEPTHSNIIIY